MKPIPRTLILPLMAVVAISVAAKPRGIANIYMKDGSRYTDVVIKCPNGWDDKIQFKDGETKCKVMSDSIEHMEIWHEDNPENKVYLLWCNWTTGDAKKGKLDEVKAKNKKWFSLEAAGDNLAYWMSITNVKPGKKSISMNVTPSPHFLMKRGSDVTVYIPYGAKRSITLNWLAWFLGDDEVLAEGILNEKYFDRKQAYRQGTIHNSYLLEEIVKDYTPGRKK